MEILAWQHQKKLSNQQSNQQSKKKTNLQRQQPKFRVTAEKRDNNV